MLGVDVDVDVDALRRWWCGKRLNDGGERGWGRGNELGN